MKIEQEQIINDIDQLTTAIKDVGNLLRIGVLLKNETKLTIENCICLLADRKDKLLTELELLKENGVF